MCVHLPAVEGVECQYSCSESALKGGAHTQLYMSGLSPIYALRELTKMEEFADRRQPTKSAHCLKNDLRDSFELCFLTVAILLIVALFSLPVVFYHIKVAHHISSNVLYHTCPLYPHADRRRQAADYANRSNWKRVSPEQASLKQHELLQSLQLGKSVYCC